MFHAQDCDQMPSIIMKTKMGTCSVKDKSSLGLCKGSNAVFKKPIFHTTSPEKSTELDMLIQKLQDDYASSSEASAGEMNLSCDGFIHFEISNDSTFEESTAHDPMDFSISDLIASSLEENPEITHFNEFKCPETCSLEVPTNQFFISEDFDPHLFIKSFPESDAASTRKKSVTLVLDLDETLVHSTLDHCLDADFTFNVFFNMKEHTVYVKQRPHLRTFLERVAEMFEVYVFTASQSVYAEQLLDILDPQKKLFSRRIFRESCVLLEGSYTKDLTILGVDLAKIAIVDNSPQVFRLQKNNGIPIKSWFSDASDCALISLLSFLETLVDVEDVRPIISKRFGSESYF